MRLSLWKTLSIVALEGVVLPGALAQAVPGQSQSVPDMVPRYAPNVVPNYGYRPGPGLEVQPPLNMEPARTEVQLPQGQSYSPATYAGGLQYARTWPSAPYSSYPQSWQYSPYSNNGEINGQSPYWYYRSGQPYRGYEPPSHYAPYIVRPAAADAAAGQQYITAPCGLMMPAELATSISTQAARSGDYIQANIEGAVRLQGWYCIPSGSKLTGEITEAQPGRLLGRAGTLGISIDHLILPEGQSIAIQAHVVGRIGRYSEKDGIYRGEGWGTKVANVLERGAIGAGGGALFGTVLGDIGGGGRWGVGAWSGAGFGSGVGILDALMARRGHNVIIHAGTPLQVQLDDSVQIPVSAITGTR